MKKELQYMVEEYITLTDRVMDMTAKEEYEMADMYKKMKHRMREEVRRRDLYPAFKELFQSEIDRRVRAGTY